MAAPASVLVRWLHSTKGGASAVRLRTTWCMVRGTCCALRLRGACCARRAGYCALWLRTACCGFGLGLALLSQIGSTCPQQSDRQASAVGDGATYTDMCAGVKLASD